MARRPRYLGKPLLILLVGLVLWVVTPPVVGRLVRIAFHEFQAPAWTAASYLGDLQTYWYLRANSKDDLIRAGRDLARLNAAYELRNQQLETLQRQVAQLESFLDLPPEPAYRYEVARVARRDVNAWWQELTIRKGRNYGIPEGAAVVFSGGVVGRVKTVHTYTATVELVSSPGFRMAAHLDGDMRPVTFRGDSVAALGQPRGHVSNILPDVDAPQDGDLRLVSSRLGGVFPDGLEIGVLGRLEPSADGLFQEGTVQLSKRLLGLREVSVLIPLESGEILLGNGTTGTPQDLLP